MYCKPTADSQQGLRATWVLHSDALRAASSFGMLSVVHRKLQFCHALQGLYKGIAPIAGEGYKVICIYELKCVVTGLQSGHMGG